jgi:hydrogenase nickel incorporation protein HypA/HybF
MHELSIALSMIEQISEESERQGGFVVEAIHLRIGVLSGVDRNALASAYELACEGTPLEGSRLVVESVPLVIRCTGCGQERSPSSPTQLCCRQCETAAQEVIQGKELEITTLEIAA